jgi:hypothetical protein
MVKSNVAEVTVNPSLSVSIQPLSSTITLGESVDFTSTVSGGTLPYSYQWYLNDTAVDGADDPSWTFTPTSTGYYLVCLKVTDGASAVALSNEAEVTVNPKTYTLKIESTAGGTTNPSPGTYTYNEGTNVQVTAIPDANYKFVYWELNGSNVGSANPINILMNASYVLKAHFAIVTYTLAISASAGGTTNPTPGTYIYEAGSYASVTALPSANYMFSHWVLDGSPAGSANPISVLMNANRTLQAVFSIINYTLTITASAGGTTSPVPGTYVYASGSDVQVTALPNLNYKFVRWEIDGANVTDNPITITMNQNYTLHAVFQLLTYKLTILSSSGGTTNPAPGTYTYTNGTYASVTAIPDMHYLLSYWLLDGNPAGSANPISVLMTDDHTLQPMFALRNYTLTITATAGGTTDPAPGVYTYSGGASVQVTALPEAGYRFDHWVLDGSPNGSANPISILMNSNHTLQAVFAETHTLVITVSAGGTTSPVPGTYNYNVPTNVSVTAIPYVNYRFDHWVYDGENIGSANPVTVYVGSNHTLHAVFALITRTLKIETTTGGTTNPAPGTYTHSNGTTVQVTAIANANYKFDHWELDTVNVGSANPYSVLMNADHTLKAVFVYSPPPPQLSVSINPLSATIKVGESVFFTSSVSGGTPPYNYTWYLNGNPVPGATSNSWTFSPTASGVYYVYLNVTDSQGNSAQSSVARITVTDVTPPVGGYTVPLVKPSLTVQLASYAVLMAFFCFVLSLVRRKRK